MGALFVGILLAILLIANGAPGLVTSIPIIFAVLANLFGFTAGIMGIMKDKKKSMAIAGTCIHGLGILFILLMFTSLLLWSI